MSLFITSTTVRHQTSKKSTSLHTCCQYCWYCHWLGGLRSSKQQLNAAPSRSINICVVVARHNLGCCTQGACAPAPGRGAVTTGMTGATWTGSAAAAVVLLVARAAPAAGVKPAATPAGVEGVVVDLTEQPSAKLAPAGTTYQRDNSNHQAYKHVRHHTWHRNCVATL